MSRYLYHVTLTTGHVRRSPRSEVGDHVVDELRPLLDRALRGERVPVPGFPGYTFSGGVHGQCCAITLWGTVSEQASPEPVPILTIGVAPHSRCGAHLWRHLHEREDLSYATDPEDVPPEPWCADRLDVGAALGDWGALHWTGDFARCIAWTWIELREEGPHA